MPSRPSVKPAHIVLFALLIGPVVLDGCSQSRMTDQWTDHAYNDGTLKKVLAVAVRKDPARRRIWEDAFVEELKAHGVAATGSYTVFPSTVPDSSQVSDIVRREGYDGVAVSARLPNTTEETYVAGYTKRELVRVSRPFLRGYTTYWRDVRIPGYTETNEVRRFQTSVWTTHNGGRMIWSGTIETADAVAEGPVRNAIRDLIVAELAAAGILPPRIK
ncbi:hypothetical protein JXA88_01380 [Candidatus Fermentibacteria bacterium]|nr:hypothetical protein [Candidatus Fermentibacteria bacterium]